MSLAHAEITNLLHTYAERMDAGEFEAIADMFADAVITVEGSDATVQGRDGVLAAYSQSAQLYDDGTPRTKHVITNAIIEVDEPAGTATSRSYFTVLQAVDGRLPLQPVLAGRYRHTMVRRIDGTWRMASMHIIWDLVGDLGAHLKGWTG